MCPSKIIFCVSQQGERFWKHCPTPNMGPEKAANRQYRGHSQLYTPIRIIPKSELKGVLVFFFLCLYLIVLDACLYSSSLVGRADQPGCQELWVPRHSWMAGVAPLSHSKVKLLWHRKFEVQSSLNIKGKMWYCSPVFSFSSPINQSPSIYRAARDAALERCALADECGS